MFGRDRVERRRNSLAEVVTRRLHPVRAARLSPACGLHERECNEIGAHGPSASGRDLVQCLERENRVQLSAGALVGKRRVRVPICDDVSAPLEDGLDDVGHQFRACSGEEEGLGPRRDLRVGVEEQGADVLPEGRAAGLADGDDLFARGAEGVGQHSGLRALARAVDALE